MNTMNKKLGFYSPKSTDQLLFQGDTMRAVIGKEDENKHRLFVIVPNFDMTPVALCDYEQLSRDNSYAPNGYKNVLHGAVADAMKVDSKELEETQLAGLVPDDKFLAQILQISDPERRIPHAVFAFILKPGLINVATETEGFSFTYGYELNEEQKNEKANFIECVTLHFEDMHSTFGNHEEAVDAMKSIIRDLKVRKA